MGDQKMFSSLLLGLGSYLSPLTLEYIEDALENVISKDAQAWYDTTLDKSRQILVDVSDESKSQDDDTVKKEENFVSEL